MKSEAAAWRSVARWWHGGVAYHLGVMARINGVSISGNGGAGSGGVMASAAK